MQRTIPTALAALAMVVFVTTCESETSVKNQATENTNRLASEQSPYLLQHATNPVDWYPWGDEAFAKAVEEDKPIFLSIGYSTCHWCHVMEAESFEDDQVASLMNRVFVAIKVDREERPDIDGIYMTVAQMLTGSGGWPLNIVMTPDRRPFFAATYIPKENRGGRVGMVELIPRIEEVWKSKRQEVESSANQITDALAKATAVARGTTEADTGDLGRSELELSFSQLQGVYEPEFGGFNAKPKFPTPHNLIFLLRYWRMSGEARALDMATHTLTQMRLGGIYDHVGFGFHRYSTDREWLVPHFEKMLYDQALLIMAYTEAYLATSDDLYAQTAKEVAAYVLRDMTSPQGGFYSAEDADSEGEEGKFYLWKENEIRRILQNQADTIISLAGVTQDGNYHDEASGAASGDNIVHLSKPIPNGSQDAWETARRRLFDSREKRAHPYKDDKVLTDWNGLMIAALARAGRHFNRPDYTDAAERAAQFLRDNMRRSDGRLLHRYRGGEAGIDAHLSDYAFLTMGLVDLYQATFNAAYLSDALELADRMIEDFWDDENGGFFFTSDVGEQLLVRQKEIHDSALPSGNSVAMTELVRLARLTGRTDLEDRAYALGRALKGPVSQAPALHTHLMTAVSFLQGPAYEVVVVGDRNAGDTQEVLAELAGAYLPNMVVLLKDGHEDIEELVPFVRYHVSIDGRATVYVCQNFACELPTSDMAKVRELLDLTD